MTSRPPLRTRTVALTVAALAATVLAADQITKQLAIHELPPRQPVPVIGDALVLYLTRNPGAAFSLGESVTWIFTLALAAVAVAAIVMIRRVRSRAWAIVLGLLLGGVLGNLTDRMLREPAAGVGHVVDFISTPWLLPAVYNIADIFIVGSMIALALLILLGRRLDAAASPSADAGAGDGRGTASE